MTVRRQLLFAGSVQFLGATPPVPIYLTDSDDATIGASLLAACRLLVDFPAAAVRLTCKPPRRGKRKAEDHPCLSSPPNRLAKPPLTPRHRSGRADPGTGVGA